MLAQEPARAALGAHLSCAKGFEAMAREARSIDATTFAFFTRNPRGGKAKDVCPSDLAAFATYCTDEGIDTFVAHGAYTINPASAKPEVREFARIALADDLARMEQTPHQLFNMHPGSHTGQGSERGIELVAQCLNEVMFPTMTTTLLLETMAGKGSELGATFQELAAIIERLDMPEKVGVCLDTCHVWDAGYDIACNLEGVLAEFDSIIGLDRLYALHVNDSLNERGSLKDRHACIGKGEIGSSALYSVVAHPRLKNLPFILETPSGIKGWEREIAFFRTGNPSLLENDA